MTRRACDQCLGTDTQSHCEAGQCYAEHMREQEAQEAEDRQREYEQWQQEQTREAYE